MLALSFAADAAGQGHLVFVVNEEGNLDMREYRELRALLTAKGQWHAICRLTNGPGERRDSGARGKPEQRGPQRYDRMRVVRAST